MAIQKTILVTGGAGFIGSHASERFLKNSKIGRVVCVDNLDPAYPISFKKENLALLTPNKKFKFYKADIRDEATINKIFKKEKPDYVVHIAAKTDTRTSLLEPKEYETVNIGGTVNLLEASKNQQVKKFIFISSSSIYGNNTSEPPFKETESTDLPLSLYGATKKAGEVIAHSYFYNYGISVSCIRLFNVYGERMRPGPVISKWVENVLASQPINLSSTEIRKRDFTYVSDVVDAIEKLIEKVDGYNIFNIANSNPASLPELLKVVEQACGKKAVVNKVESNKASIKISHADISKAKKLIGWKPKVSLEKGVLRYVSWFRKNRSKNSV